MNRTEFDARLQNLMRAHEELLTRRNVKAENGNGIFDRYVNPVLTAAHAPLFWRYDFDYETNPHLLERMGVNAMVWIMLVLLNTLLMAFSSIVDKRVLNNQILHPFVCVAFSELLVYLYASLDRSYCHERLRHAFGQARGRLDLRTLLHGA